MRFFTYALGGGALLACPHSARAADVLPFL